MPYLVRKITRAKWQPGSGLAETEIPADAVTVDLRTAGNTLSFWRLETPENDDEIRNIALALAAAGERVDRMDLTWIELDGIREQGVSIETSDGRTPVVSLRANHVNMIALDMQRLCKVAGLIAASLAQNQFRRFTKREILQIVSRAVENKLVSLDKLAPKVKREVSTRADI